MKYALTLFILLLFVCKQPVASAVINRIHESIDTSKYSIMRFENYESKYFDDKDTNYVAADLSDDEIIKIESIISIKVAQNNKEQKKLSDSVKKAFPHATFFSGFIDHSEKYYKQLLPVLNSKGEKEVWVNCFCNKEEKAYWRKFMIGVSGGGSCYFDIRINLTNSEVTHFSVNDVI